jgi:hypothetical protein
VKCRCSKHKRQPPPGLPEPEGDLGFQIFLRACVLVAIVFLGLILLVK